MFGFLQEGYLGQGLEILVEGDGEFYGDSILGYGYGGYWSLMGLFCLENSCEVWCFCEILKNDIF